MAYDDIVSETAKPVPSERLQSRLTAITKEEYWACACVRRDRDGAMSHIKLNHPGVRRCRACEAERPEYGMYLCKSCDKLIFRDSTKRYLTSLCSKTGKRVRIYRV